MKSAILGCVLMISSLAFAQEVPTVPSEKAPSVTPSAETTLATGSNQEFAKSEAASPVKEKETSQLRQATVIAQATSQESSATPAQEPVANQDNSSYVLCRNEKRVRTIRVDLKPGSCKAIYSKDGTEDIVGRSATAELCYDVVHKIRANLEKGPWKCKDMKPDRVSFTQE